MLQLTSLLRTTPQIAAATSALLALLFSASVTLAQNQIVLRTGNDDFAGNSITDDIYTAGLGFTLEFDRDRPVSEGFGRRFVEFEENLFTDSNANLRFDETWLLFGRRVGSDTWTGSVFVGGVRAGRGLLGEDLQNGVHRLIGDEELEIDYVPNDRDFAAIGGDFRRLIHAAPRLSTEVRAEGRIAPGFQRWLSVSISGTWKVNHWLSVVAAGGARVSHSEYAPLDPWIRSLAPTAELTLQVRERWVFSWTHNAHGTDLGHVGLSYRLPLSAVLRSRGGAPPERLGSLDFSPPTEPN